MSPELEPAVDPDLLIAREAAAQQWEQHFSDKFIPRRRRGGMCDDGGIVTACRRAARMAREQERERAKVLVEYLAYLETFGSDDSLSSILRGAREARAKYEETNPC